MSESTSPEQVTVMVGGLHMSLPKGHGSSTLVDGKDGPRSTGGVPGHRTIVGASMVGDGS